MKKTPMDAFNVIKKSNEGVKLALSLPDGTPTEEFVVVCGQDSKAFRAERARADRAKVEAAKKHKDDVVKFDEALEEINRKLVASLVKDWSFEQDCNEKNVAEFFRQAPQVQNEIDKFAGGRANFFDKPRQD